MIGRSIIIMLLAALLLCPNAVICQSYEMGQIEELAGLKWGMMPGDIKSATRFSMANRLTDMNYRGYKDFLVPKYGAPMHEDLSVPVMIWSEGDKHTVFRWLEKDSAFCLVFR